MKLQPMQKKGVIFRFATRVIFVFMLVSMVSFTYPPDGSFFSKLLVRLHALFFEGSKRTGPSKVFYPRGITSTDTVRNPALPPPPPPPDTGR